MSSEREKEVLFNILTVYKDMPHLWNKEHKDYKNKIARSDGFRVLLEIYSGFDKDATVRTLKKKIENMRTSYLKEVKKVIASKNEEDTYVPTLWYFDAFSFLGYLTTEPYRPTTDPLKYERESSPSSGEEISYENAKPSYREVPVLSIVPAKKIKILQPQDDVPNSAKRPIPPDKNIKEEELQVYGKSIGLQLRDLKYNELAIAQKLISDVIYYAKIGKLTEAAHVALS